MNEKGTVTVCVKCLSVFDSEFERLTLYVGGKIARIDKETADWLVSVTDLKEKYES